MEKQTPSPWGIGGTFAKEEAAAIKQRADAAIDAIKASLVASPEEKAAELRRYSTPTKQRAGITKNHGQPRNKRRAHMARYPRRRNRRG